MIDLLWVHSIVYQVITLNGTQPCFLNQTAGPQLWQNCGFDKDWVQAAIAPWQWVTGGWFTMILVSIFVIMSYIKYQKMVYPLLVGVFFIPISYALFPPSFVNFAVIMAFLGAGLLVGWIFISQTNEQ